VNCRSAKGVKKFPKVGDRQHFVPGIAHSWIILITG
jgi:hypothetical protein